MFLFCSKINEGDMIVVPYTRQDDTYSWNFRIRKYWKRLYAIYSEVIPVSPILSVTVVNMLDSSVEFAFKETLVQYDFLLGCRVLQVPVGKTAEFNVSTENFYVDQTSRGIQGTGNLILTFPNADGLRIVYKYDIGSKRIWANNITINKNILQQFGYVWNI